MNADGDIAFRYSPGSNMLLGRLGPIAGRPSHNRRERRTVWYRSNNKIESSKPCKICATDFLICVDSYRQGSYDGLFYTPVSHTRRLKNIHIFRSPYKSEQAKGPNFCYIYLFVVHLTARARTARSV
jgi:hypothetical protein